MTLNENFVNSFPRKVSQNCCRQPYDAMMEGKMAELETKKGLLKSKETDRAKEEKDMTGNEAVQTVGCFA